MLEAHRHVERGQLAHHHVELVGLQLLGRHAHQLGGLLGRRVAPVAGDEPLAGAAVARLGLAHRSRRPVLAAQLVDDRALHARPGEALQRDAAVGVEAVDRPDERLDADRDEVVGVEVRRDLADLPVDEVLHHRRQREDQPVAQPRIARALEVAVQRLRLLRRRLRRIADIAGGRHPVLRSFRAAGSTPDRWAPWHELRVLLVLSDPAPPARCGRGAAVSDLTRCQAPGTAVPRRGRAPGHAPGPASARTARGRNGACASRSAT